MQQSLFSKILLAADHAGVYAKVDVVSYLEIQKDRLGFDSIIDFGTFNANVRVDYPVFAHIVAVSIKRDDVCGILTCARGIGMSIAANRFKHIRAALCYDIRSAFFARSHSNANLIVLSSECGNSQETTHEMIKTFLTTEFQGGRYQSRLDMIDSNADLDV